MSAVKYTTGFDYLRIVLSTLVLFIHSKQLTLGADKQAFELLLHSPISIGHFSIARPPIYQPIIWAIVPAFFALSGFLVAGSMQRSKTTIGFLMLRVLRILPALCVESLLAMLVLGPLVTTLPLAEYFRDPLFQQYPLNIIGDIHYLLPGVFTNNPFSPSVNLQLWTIPAEMQCYAFLAAVLVLQLSHLRWTVPILTVATFGYFLGGMALGVHAPVDWAGGGTRAEVETLLMAFMVGVSLYELREFVPLRYGYFIMSVILTYVLLWDGNLQYLAAIPVAYATVYVGLTNLSKTVINRLGDYSYGVYLYGLPMQQLIVYLFPDNKNWLLNFVLAYVLSLLFAAFSWHFIESKVLMKKKMVVEAAEALVRPFTIRLAWGRRDDRV